MRQKVTTVVLRRMRDTVRANLMTARIWYLNRIWGHQIAASAGVSFSSFLDRTSPELISIGEYSIVTRGMLVLSHDFSRGRKLPTSIVANCLIGSNSVILPGTRIENGVVVGAGSVVTRDVPDGGLVAGNPARLVRKSNTTNYGRIVD